VTRILLVDDDPGLRDLFGIVLDAEGYVVQVTDDGHHALAALPPFAPDLLITDLQMPAMSGWEVRARAREAQPTLPALVISASTNLQPPHGMGLPPHTRLLPKPCGLEELLECIRQLLGDSTS